MSRPGPVTIWVLADNTLATLNRIVSVLRARRFNVTAVATARTRRPDVLGIAIVVAPAKASVDRVLSTLDKIEEVQAVRTLDGPRALRRELLLMTVRREALAALPLSLLVQGHTARVLDEGRSAAIVELAGEPEELDAIIAGLGPESIVDLARVGPVTASLDYD